MAKPIAKTPVFEGEDAIAVLKEMQEAPARKIKSLQKKSKIRELFYSQDNIFLQTLFFIYFLYLCKDWNFFQNLLL